MKILFAADVVPTAKMEQQFIDAKVEELARALGLMGLGLEHDVSDLSGGQRTKVLLAKLLLEKPDILKQGEEAILPAAEKPVEGFVPSQEIAEKLDGENE